MGKCIFIIVLVLSLNTGIIAQSFDGVPIRGNYTELVKIFKSKNFVQTFLDESGVILRGKVLDKEVNLIINFTPKSKQAYSLGLIYDQIKKSDDLRKEYEKLMKIFLEKYGANSTSGSNDDFELLSVWNKEGFEVRLGISANERVVVGYKNLKNAKLYDKEIIELQKAIF